MARASASLTLYASSHPKLNVLFPVHDWCARARFAVAVLSPFCWQLSVAHHYIRRVCSVQCARVRARLSSASALTPNEFVMLKCNKMHETRTPSSCGSHLLVNMFWPPHALCLVSCLLNHCSVIYRRLFLHFANGLDVNTKSRCMKYPQHYWG